MELKALSSDLSRLQKRLELYEDKLLDAPNHNSEEAAYYKEMAFFYRDQVKTVRATIVANQDKTEPEKVAMAPKESTDSLL